MIRLKAVELLTTATCPFNCNYCYIPKTEMLKEVHAKIEERLKSGEAFDSIVKFAGNEIEHLGFWGTEPTLTLPLIEPHLDKIKGMFPKLQKIDFSTSLLQPERVVSFVQQATARGFKCGVQTSVDGAAFISDVNRAPGTADRIKKNVAILRDGLKGNNLFDLRFKATITNHNIHEMVTNPALIDEYNDYFKDLYEIGKGIPILPGTDRPTLMIPGHYTVEDGKEFAEYVRLVHSKGHKTAYTGRLQKLFDFSSEVLGKRCMYSCSGGDSNCGVSENQHICHRSFFCDLPEYLESLDEFDRDNWDVSNFESGILDIIHKYYTPSEPDPRYDYVLRGYHDNWALEVATTSTLTQQLARAGQCEEKFLADELYLQIFSFFLNTALSCPMENLLNSGSLHLMPLSLIRMFGNGAFGEVMNDLSRGK